MKTLKSQVRTLSNKKKTIFFYWPFFLFISMNIFSYRWLCTKHHFQHFFSHTITINCVLAHVGLKHFTLIIPTLFFKKKGTLISQQSLSIVRLNVRPSVCPCITFLVNIYPSKPFNGATSNFLPRQVTCCRGYWAIFRVTLTPRSRSKVR